MYNVVAKRLDLGEFTVSYGRGGKRLKAVIDRSEVSPFRWRVREGNGNDYFRNSGGFVTFKAAKESWGEWAADVYVNGESHATLADEAKHACAKLKAEPDFSEGSVIPLPELDEYFTPDKPSHSGDAWPENRHDQNSFERLIGLYGKDFLLTKIYSFRKARP